MLILKLIETILCFTAVGKVRGSLRTVEWIDDVVDYVRNDASVFRVVLLVNQTGREEGSIVNDVQQKIVRGIPCDIVDIRGSVFTNKKYLPKYNNHLRTILVIMLHNLKKNLQTSQESELKTLLGQVTENFEQPKCLIILFLEETSFNHESILRFAWSKQFLDLTLLKHVQKQIRMNKPTGKSHFFFGSESIITIHFFNPFKNTFLEKTYSNGLVLFPNKLQNLHGYEMKVVAISSPPDTYITKTSSGEVIKVSGFQGKIVTTISQVMNFIPQFVPLKGSGYGIPNCNKNKTTGFARYVLQGMVRFGYNPAPYILCGSKYLTTYSKPIGIMYLYPIVPILKKPSALTVSTESIKALVVIILLLLTVKIVMFIFDFDKYYHEMLNMFALSLGNGLSMSPDKISQRIVFCFLLLGFWLFSSDIYGLLTEIKMTKDTFLKLDTLEDIHASNLSLMMPANTLFILRSRDATIMYQELLKKTVINPRQEGCLKYLMKHRNVTCVMPLEPAKMYLEQFRIKYNFREMKIGKEYLQKYITGIVFESGSPYVKGVDRIIAKLIVSGLVGKWMEDDAPTPEEKQSQLLEDDGSESTAVLKIILYLVAVVGLGVSSLVFGCELLLQKSQRIVFCFLLLGFGLFSSNIYGLLTDIKMTKDTFLKLDTLEDIHASNLSLMMPVNTLIMLRSREATKMYDELLKKTVINPRQESCLEYLMKHKNVTCVMPLESAKMYIEKFRIKYNFRQMKIGNEYFQKYTSGIGFEPNSPFVKGFDRILAKLTDFGFVEKWTEDYAPTPEAKQIHLDEDGAGSSTILLILLLFVLIVGFGVALLIFFGELMVGRSNLVIKL